MIGENVEKKWRTLNYVSVDRNLQFSIEYKCVYMYNHVIVLSNNYKPHFFISGRPLSSSTYQAHALPKTCGPRGFGSVLVGISVL